MNEREELILKCKNCKFMKEYCFKASNETTHEYSCELIYNIINKWVEIKNPEDKLDICPFDDVNFIGAYMKLREKVNNI